ncbi:MAG: DUF362 domain-containing protein [Clostridia bacterium]|nr:DUF362 domain-containing protein [Clostridia bacterium]
MEKEQTKNYDCAVVRCGGYEKEQVKAALEEAIGAIGGLDFVQKGMKIAVKPNLVSFKKPEEAVTTHPMLLEALVEMLLERGADIVIGDSPGGPNSAVMLSRVYAATGMNELEREGVKLNRSLEEKTEDNPEGKQLKRITYTAYLKEADAIIDFCKLKSHGMMGMSAAVKNLYGAIPGLLKPQMHYQFPNEADFADMLIDLNEFLKPRLSICDAVVGMEGNGPLNGRPREVGAIIAAHRSYDCDLVAAELIGRKFDELPTLKAAYDRGLAPKTADELSIYGNINEFRVPDFEAPPVRGLRFMRKGTVLHFVSSKALAQKPSLNKEKCVGCGECARLCPAKAISMKNKKPVIDRHKCIRCFCCQEFCPKAAMVVHRPLVARALNKMKL